MGHWQARRVCAAARNFNGLMLRSKDLCSIKTFCSFVHRCLLSLFCFLKSALKHTFFPLTDLTGLQSTRDSRTWLLDRVLAADVVVVIAIGCP